MNESKNERKKERKKKEKKTKERKKNESKMFSRDVIPRPVFLRSFLCSVQLDICISSIEESGRTRIDPRNR